MSGAGEKKSIGVGILGFGNVGGALVGLIADNGEMIETRAGVGLRVARVAVRNVSKNRPVALPDGWDPALASDGKPMTSPTA